MLLHLVPPAVATALYLRAAYAPTRPLLTYVGGCPAAADESIDVWLTVDALLAAFADRSIVPDQQPTEFDSVIPPDRRRYFSDPGGVPSRNVLRHLSTPVDLVELSEEDVIVDLAEHLLSGSRSLIDASARLGCCCRGASGELTPEEARARLRQQEPPRAPSPIVDHSLRLALEFVPAMNAGPRASVDSSAIGLRADAERKSVPDAATEPIATAARRRSAPGMQRPVLGATPLRRSEGRQLPRAFVARRRSSPRGLRQSLVRAAQPSLFGLRAPWGWIVAVGAAVLVLGAVIAAVLRFAR